MKIMQTEKILSSAGETFEYARIYMEQQGEYLRLEASKRMAKSISQLVTFLVVTFLGMLVLIFLTLAIGLLLGKMWGSYGLAFLVLTAFYAVAAILIYSFRSQVITNPIVKIIVSNLLD